MSANTPEDRDAVLRIAKKKNFIQISRSGLLDCKRMHMGDLVFFR